VRSNRRVLFFFILLIGVFGGLIFRCYQLQVIQNEHFIAKSNKQIIRIPQKPKRGAILDSRGRVLAASNRKQVIFADPEVIGNDLKATAEKLAPIIGINSFELCKQIIAGKNPRYVKLKEVSDYEQCAKAAKINGIGVESDWERYYPTGQVTSHVVGLAGSDNSGFIGVEQAFSTQLAGVGGVDEYMSDIFRRPVRPKDLGKGLQDGVGIILTLDTTIQQFVREELYKRYKEFEAEAAMAIVAEAKTGAILAMVSLPDYDPEARDWSDGNDLCNHVISDQFEPGSILKPIVAAIALDCGAVSRTEKIFCENGSYSGKGFGRIGEYRDKGYGNLTVKEILINSSNIGMAKIGQKMGKDNLYNGLSLFGFGKSTGISLPGEGEGRLWPVSRWTGYSVTRIPFGQEISATCLQLVRAFCILASGGRNIRPFIVKAVVDSNGEVVSVRRGSPPVGYVIDPDVAKYIVNDAMVAVVNEGTGKRAKLEKWQVFGKTGTADIAKVGAKGYDENTVIASFVAGAPAEDPQIVVLVSVRKPNKSLGKGYTGGVVSSPVAAKIIERTLTYLERD
jgi:cell division protein FtsI (penicillin-binding protein 3)